MSSRPARCSPLCPSSEPAPRPRKISRTFRAIETLILRWSQNSQPTHVDFDLWNGYPVGANHQNGLGLFYEPLAFYSAFADEMIPWLAESWEYNDDLTELRIKTRSGINWSDGQPFSAEDVAFTLNAVREAGTKVRWGVDVDQFVDDATAESDTEVAGQIQGPGASLLLLHDLQVRHRSLHRAQAHLRGPGPRLLQRLRYRQWLAGDDRPLEARLLLAGAEGHRPRDSWWAVDQGLVEACRRVKRIIYLPWTEETQIAQQLISNEIDCSLDLRPLTMETILAQNPAIITHTVQRPALRLRRLVADLALRQQRARALQRCRRSLGAQLLHRSRSGHRGGARRRRQHVAVAAAELSGSAALRRVDLRSAREVPDLEFNPEKGAALLEGKGWAKNADGIWAKDGKTLDLDIISFAVMADIGPVIAEQLRRQGVNASFAMPPDFFDRFQQGDYNGALFGHGGSVSGDPYFTLRLYQSNIEAVPGGHQVNFSLGTTTSYDKIVDEMAVTPPEDRTADRSVAAGDGDLAAGAAGHPDSGVVPPHPDEHHLLAGLADQG